MKNKKMWKMNVLVSLFLVILIVGGGGVRGEDYVWWVNYDGSYIRGTLAQYNTPANQVNVNQQETAKLTLDAIKQHISREGQIFDANQNKFIKITQNDVIGKIAGASVQSSKSTSEGFDSTGTVAGDKFDLAKARQVIGVTRTASISGKAPEQIKEITFIEVKKGIVYQYPGKLNKEDITAYKAKIEKLNTDIKKLEELKKVNPLTPDQEKMFKEYQTELAENTKLLSSSFGIDIKTKFDNINNLDAFKIKGTVQSQEAANVYISESNKGNTVTIENNQVKSVINAENGILVKTLSQDGTKWDSVTLGNKEVPEPLRASFSTRNDAKDKDKKIIIYNNQEILGGDLDTGLELGTKDKDGKNLVTSTIQKLAGGGTIEKKASNAKDFEANKIITTYTAPDGKIAEIDANGNLVIRNKAGEKGIAVGGGYNSESFKSFNSMTNDMISTTDSKTGLTQEVYFSNEREGFSTIQKKGNNVESAKFYDKSAKVFAYARKEPSIGSDGKPTGSSQLNVNFYLPGSTDVYYAKVKDAEIVKDGKNVKIKEISYSGNNNQYITGKGVVYDKNMVRVDSYGVIEYQRIPGGGWMDAKTGKVLTLNEAKEKISSVDSDNNYAEVTTLAGRFFSGYTEAALIGQFLSQYKPYSSVSSLLMGEESYTNWRESVDAAFASAYLGVDYWASEICKSQFKTIGKQIAYISSPGGVNIQFVAHIEAERSNPMPKECPCASGQECRAGFCYSGNDLQYQYFYKITYVVRSPSDVKMTPMIDEKGEAVSFNIKLYGDNIQKDIYSEPVGIKPGAAKKAIGSTAIVKYSSNLYNKICINFIKKPISTAGNEIGNVCNKISVDEKSNLNWKASPGSGISSTPSASPSGMSDW